MQFRVEMKQTIMEKQIQYLDVSGNKTCACLSDEAALIRSVSVRGAAEELIPFTWRETRLGRRQLRPIRQRDVMDRRDVEIDALTRFDSVVF